MPVAVVPPSSHGVDLGVLVWVSLQIAICDCAGLVDRYIYRDPVPVGQLASVVPS